MSRIVNMPDAETNLSRLVHDLEAGEAQEFIIARNGRPAVRLVPWASVVPDRSRRIGRARGKFEVPDPMEGTDDDMRWLFEGS